MDDEQLGNDGDLGQEVFPELQGTEPAEPAESPRPSPQQFDEAAYFRQEAQQNSARVHRLEQELAALQRSSQQQRYDPRAEQEYLSQLDPDQRLAYYREQDRQYADQRFMAQQVQTHDALDRIQFEHFLDRNPHYASLRDEVEAQHRQNLELAVRAGNPSLATRQKALALISFDKNQTAGARARTAAQKQADQTKQRQTTKPASTGSTVSRSRTQSDDRSVDAARRRLIEAGWLEPE
jgi:hypothetical protein